MARSPARHARPGLLAGVSLRVTAVAAGAAVCAGLCTPAAFATSRGGTPPPPRMFGYAAGPVQRNGTAAGKAHYVPASATRAGPGAQRIKGHPAPVPRVLPPLGHAGARAHAGPVTMPAGHEIAGHRLAPSTPAQSGPRTSSGAKPAVASPDNASYSVAATFDTVPMADQAGRIAVTLTNTGTSTWDSGYALGSRVFSASNTTGTGTPLDTGASVALTGSVAPGGSVTVESVTPAENPGSYTLCWDMVNGAGTYFSAEGGTQDCAAYTIQQFAPAVNEQEPLPGTDVDSQTPVLSASAVVPGGYPANPEFSFAFEILSSPALNGTNVIQSSGWVPDNGNTWVPATPLTWGSTYYWAVTVTDQANPPPVSSSSGNWTTPISFVVGNAQPKVWYRLGNGYQADDGDPIMTSDLGGTDYNGSGKTVDPRTGNVSELATDADVATVGPPLTITRIYNSLDPRTSQAFGAGWSSVLDMSLSPDPDGSGALVLTLADGQQVRFAKTAAGGYAPPQGMYAVVTPQSGGGFSVTDQTATTYSFTQASGPAWLLSKITDGDGMAETLSYSSGALATITNTTSGRSLHVTWTTPTGASTPHVASVSTDPVTAGQPGTALTWAYHYNGDLLSSVCPPVSSTACTSYGYLTNGSHGPTSVLNADPTSYYRLDEPAGAAAAANQIPVNDLATLDPPAEEMNTTPGVPGPIPGTTATGFNGTSSYIPLDGTWCNTPGQASSCTTVPDAGRLGSTAAGATAMSIWFKTSTPSGVLLGLTAGLPPAHNCAPNCISSIAEPLLWIASNGHLDGYAGQTPMSSPAAVDDGTWHQAVLVPGQALYLDGSKVASSTGLTGFVVPAASVALLGAGLVPQNAFSSSWQYFNGSLADVSVYQNQLPGVGTVAAQYAAETHPAAELTSVTTPAGRSAFSAVYDTVNDRVSSVTDASGGTWSYGRPVAGSSSAGYDSAVMSSGPEDFWPLSDTTGPLAQDLVASPATAASPRPPATYSNVTLGAAGPTGFADGTAASLTGSGSQITVPGGYFGGTGAQAVELWFKTSTTGSTSLLSTGSSGSGPNPPALWITAGGCLAGSIGGTTLGVIGSTCGAQSVTNGKWHQAVLTLSPVTTASGVAGVPGSPSQTAALYLDGVLSQSLSVPPATTPGSGYPAVIGNGPKGDFAGSLADVSLYTAKLTSTQVTGHYDSLANRVTLPNPNPLNPPPPVTLPTLNTQVITVADPAGKHTDYAYADGALVRTTGPLGGVTSYGYDSATRAATITDPDGDTTYLTYDAHNNVTSTTNCAAINDCQTAYASYYENLASPLDPRNDKPTDSRDPRSSSSSDPTYDTVTTYTPAAQVATISTPPTAACPSGCTIANTYTAGTEAAVGGGTEPAGLLASVTTPKGGMTSYGYDSSGDLKRVTDPLGLVTTYTYDNLGRKLTATQVPDTYPGGLTTRYTYDGLGRTLTISNPPVTDRVTGAVHTEVTTRSYDADSNALTTTISDATGGDPARTTTDTYNAHGELATSTDPLGNVTSYSYDGLGDRTSITSPAGVTTQYSYDANGDLLATTLDGYTGNPANPSPPVNLTEESRAYDPAGRLASVTDVRGTQTDYTYYGDNQVASTYIPDASASGGKDRVTTYAYDPAGNVTSQTSPGGLLMATTYNAGSQVVSQTADPAGADRVTRRSYDADGNVTGLTLTGGGATQTVTATFGPTDQEMSHTVHDGSTSLTTTYTRDQRGLVISSTDPNGATTTIENDEAGQPAVETAAAVPTQAGDGSAPVTASPVTMIGYDTFGDKVEASDPDGNVTRTGFDADGRVVSVTDPSYTPPGASAPVNGTTATAYNAIGQPVSTTDPLGNVTRMSYDQLGDVASQSNPDGGVWSYAYDTAGELTSVTDPTGARSEATYDSLGQKITSTSLVRQNASAAYTTRYAYNDAGEQVSQTSPTGVSTSAVFDPLGQEISSTDGAGNTTSYAYDLDGNLTRETTPGGAVETTSYDQAGRALSQSELDSSGTVLRTQSWAYDADGNITAATDFQGNTVTSSYDADGLLTSQAQPASPGHTIAVSYGYDLAGHPTAMTDANGNTTYTTYNSLGLPEAVTDPPTAAHHSAADSVTVDSYDANGDLTTETQPGGVRLTSTYDSMGDLTGQSGTGASAPTASRTFTYDTSGRVLTAATSATGTAGTFGYQAATSESFTYDDRGLLLASSGTAGNTSLAYNASGQLTSDTSAAGTSAYTYDGAGRLATDTDAASGATGTYSYNSMGQIRQIAYGAGHDTQSFGYDPEYRLASDTVATASGAQAAAISYGYNNDNDVTSVTTSGLATPGGGTGTVANAYGYDQANRLTSWTATPAGGNAATTTYGYDGNGNLTSANGVTSSYDARNELTSDSRGNSYTYSANGDLISQSGPGITSAASTSDAYGQQSTSGSASSYTWDALNRVVSAANQGGGSTIALTYDGMTDQVSSDSSATYSRDPAGGLVGTDITGGIRTLALVNGHSDLSGVFTPSGTTLTGSTTYDPWGQVLAATGPTIEIGYQGQWTDPVTRQINMGSRFYRPATGSFTDADTAPAPADGAAVASNAYAYADDNPMSLTDPTGHAPSPSGDSGSATITEAEVNAAAAKAQNTAQIAADAETAAANARVAARQAAATASTAEAYAKQENNYAKQLYQQLTGTEAKANAAFKQVQQDQNAVADARAALSKAESNTSFVGLILGNSPLANGMAAPAGQSQQTFCVGVTLGITAAAVCAPSLGAAQAQANSDESAYNSAVSQAQQNLSTAQGKEDEDQGTYQSLQQQVSNQAKAYAQAHGDAVAAQDTANRDSQRAVAAQRKADYLTGVAAADERAAEQAEQYYETLLKEYRAQQQRNKENKKGNKKGKKRPGGDKKGGKGKGKKGGKKKGDGGGKKGGGGGGSGCPPSGPSVCGPGGGGGCLSDPVECVKTIVATSWVVEGEALELGPNDIGSLFQKTAEETTESRQAYEEGQEAKEGTDGTDAAPGLANTVQGFQGHTQVGVPPPPDSGPGISAATPSGVSMADAATAAIVVIQIIKKIISDCKKNSAAAGEGEGE